MGSLLIYLVYVDSPLYHERIESKTRQAVRRCALIVQTVHSHLELAREAVALSILMPSISVRVPVLPRCVVGKLRSLILAKR